MVLMRGFRLVSVVFLSFFLVGSAMAQNDPSTLPKCDPKAVAAGTAKGCIVDKAVEAYIYDPATQVYGYVNTDPSKICPADQKPAPKTTSKPKGKPKAKPKGKPNETTVTVITTPPQATPSSPNTVTITVTVTEWNDIKNQLTTVQSDLKKYGEDLTVLNRLTALETQLGQQPVGAPSVEARISTLIAKYDDLNSRVTKLEKRMDAVEIKNAEQDRLIDGLIQELGLAGNGVGHQLAFVYGLGFSYVRNEGPSLLDVNGLELRLGLNEKVGVHGSVGIGLNHIRTYGAPDLTWAGGLDLAFNEALIGFMQLRGVHRGVNSTLEIKDFDILGTLGLEIQLPKLKNSALTLEYGVGVQLDGVPQFERIGFVGIKHDLFAKKPQ